MLRRVALLLGLVVVLPGCANTRAVDLRSPGDVTDGHFAEINGEASTRRARLHLADGRRVTARGLRVGQDSTSWVADGRLETVATADVSRVQFTDRERGTLEGLGIGLLGGVVVGGAIGFVGYEGPSIFAGSRMGSTQLGATLLPFLTTPIGFLIGIADGHRDVYRFQAPAAD